MQMSMCWWVSVLHSGTKRLFRASWMLYPASSMPGGRDGGCGVFGTWGEVLRVVGVDEGCVSCREMAIVGYFPEVEVGGVGRRSW